MTKLQHTLNAIKNLDFTALEQLLEDDKAYMEVSKELFLDRLKQKIQPQIEKGFKGYEEILVGTCNTCYKGCNAYSFYAEDFPSLELYFDVKDGIIKDMKFCHNLKGVKKNEFMDNIYFDFFEEEKVNFKPTTAYTQTKAVIDQALERLDVYLSQPINAKAIEDWQSDLKQYKHINSPLNSTSYKAFDLFFSVYHDLDNLKTCFKQNPIAVKAMQEYQRVRNDERGLVKWHFTYRDLSISENFKIIHRDATSSYIELRKGTKLMVRDSECIQAINFCKIRGKVFNKLFQKFYIRLEDSKFRGIEAYLEKRQLYLDLLPE